MQIIRDPHAMRAFERSRRMALVPTMGYLHAGHLALVSEAKRRAELVCASIFVNPSQFGPNEDLARYPRDAAGDLAKLEGAGCDVVFMPEAAAIYPNGFSTWVVPEALVDRLCGASRPGHFRGVCTVVALLFRMTGCDIAVFGEKDYQQLAIIKRMNRDLWLGVDVVGAPIVRESDGLAMSSRNVYLDGGERKRALGLSRALNAITEARARGVTRVQDLIERGREVLGDVELDYLEIVDAETLEPLTNVDRPARALVAAKVGKTRLIDNCPL